MTDVLILVGKSKNTLGLTATATALQRSLQKQGFSVVSEPQRGNMQEAAAEARAALLHTGARALFTVGYSLSTQVAKDWLTKGKTQQVLVAVTPDVPGNADSVYGSALQNLEMVVRVCDLLLVADELSRSLVEYKVAGAAGSTGLVDDLRSCIRLLNQQVQSVEPRKILVSGHDFRFAAEVVRMLQSTPGVQVRLQKWDLDTATPANTAAVKADMAWADTVFCEWAGRQAVWYSQHLPTGKRLVVRLHGFESNATWIGELDFSRVNQLIAVSNFYRKQLVKRHGWDEGKVSVIGNSVTFDAFTRPKDDEARFHLGMLGYTPLLKRPQVAVEILRYLVQQDDRFVLHLRGRAPWNFSWVWNRKVQEADAYRTLFEMIGADPVLRQHVVFEQPGANVESWFTKIGWVLSLSHRETFHLAAAEGMASGAVPVFLRRKGVTSIFSNRWVFDSPDEIARYIAMTTPHELWNHESGVARAYASRFDFATVKDAWAQALLGEGNVRNV